MTNDEIKHALKCCTTTISPCGDCPLNGDEYGYSCRAELLKAALKLISEQEADIEELKSQSEKQRLILESIDSQNAEIENLKAQIKNLEYCYEEAKQYNDSLADGCNETCKRETKSEVIKEFAKKLNAISLMIGDGWEWLVIADFVNRLVKEMTEE